MAQAITSWKETISDGEEKELSRLAEELGALQLKKGGRERALHAKPHAALRATLTVREDIPAHAAQGVFAKPGQFPGRETRKQYNAYVRLSNGSAARQHDKEPDLRGFSIKLLGVEGLKALGDATTQDFLLIDSPTVPFKTPQEFVTFVKCIASPATLPFKLVGALGFRAFSLIGEVAKMAKGKRNSLLDLPYFSVAPMAMGPFAARLRLTPTHQPSPHAKPEADRAYLRAELIPRVRAGGVGFLLEAQFCESESELVEDTTVAWSTPFVPLAQLDILATDLESEAGKKQSELVEALSFDPWHALSEHRPLGLTMRARKSAYFVSTQNRRASAEPDGTEW